MIKILVNLSCFDQNSTFLAGFFKKTHINPGKYFPNFFFKVATESELLGPKIALGYFSNLNILHFFKKEIKETGFSARLAEFHFVLNIAKNSSLKPTF